MVSIGYRAISALGLLNMLLATQLHFFSFLFYVCAVLSYLVFTFSIADVMYSTLVNLAP